MTEHVVIQHEEATRIITMRRPDKKNALTQEMYFAISKAIDSAQDDPAIRCMIITGSSGVFTAGNDLKDFLAAGSSAENQAFGTSGGVPLPTGDGTTFSNLTVNGSPAAPTNGWSMSHATPSDPASGYRIIYG